MKFEWNGGSFTKKGLFQQPPRIRISNYGEWKLIKSWIRKVQGKLHSFRIQPDPPEDPSASAIPQAYTFRKKAQLTIAQACEFMLCIEPIWSIGAAAFVYLSALQIVGGYSWFGLIAAVLPFLARWISRGHLSQRTPFDLPIGLLLVAGMIGIGVSSDKGLSWSVHQTLLISVLFYYSFVNYDNPRLLIKGGLLIAALAVIFMGGYVFLQEPTSLPFFSQLQDWFNPEPPALSTRWATPLLAACGAAVATVVVAIIVAGVALFPGKKIERIAAGIFTIFLLGLLTISPCRATWPILAGGILFLLGWRNRWFLLSLPAWLGVVFWSVTARIGLSTQQAIDMVRDLFEIRFDRWEEIGHMLSDRPVTGWGLGMYPTVYPEYGTHGYTAHNAYLQFYSDFGLLGAVAMIIAAAVLIRMALQIMKRPSNHLWLGVTVGVWVAILVGAIYSLVESAPASMSGMGIDSYYYAISPLFAILGAALIVSYQALVGQEFGPERSERAPNES